MKFISLSLGTALLALLGACSKALEEGEVYRTIDDRAAIRVTGRNELDYQERGSPTFVGQYSIDDNNRLRIIIDMLGTRQALYFAITDEGLQDANGATLYSRANFDTARESFYCKELKVDVDKFASLQTELHKRGRPYSKPRRTKAQKIDFIDVDKQYFLIIGESIRCTKRYAFHSTDMSVTGYIGPEKAEDLLLATQSEAAAVQKAGQKAAERLKKQEIARKNSIIASALEGGKRLVGLAWTTFLGYYPIYKINVESFDRESGIVLGTIEYEVNISGATHKSGAIHSFKGTLKDGLLALGEIQETRKTTFRNGLTGRPKSRSEYLRDYRITIKSSDQKWDGNWSEKGKDFWGSAHTIRVIKN